MFIWRHCPRESTEQTAAVYRSSDQFGHMELSYFQARQHVWQLFQAHISCSGAPHCTYRGQVYAGVIEQTKQALAARQQQAGLHEGGQHSRKRRQVTALKVMLQARDEEGNAVKSACSIWLQPTCSFKARQDAKLTTDMSFVPLLSTRNECVK